MAFAPANLNLYLQTWLHTATKSRVKCMGSSNDGNLSFRCTQCMNVLYIPETALLSASQVPQALQTWVLQHRHVCDGYNPNTNGSCIGCGWPNSAHAPTPSKSVCNHFVYHSSSGLYCDNCGWREWEHPKQLQSFAAQEAAAQEAAFAQKKLEQLQALKKYKEIQGYQDYWAMAHGGKAEPVEVPKAEPKAPVIKQPTGRKFR